MAGYPPLPHELEAAAKTPGQKRVHPLLEKGTFEQLHRNDLIETRPQILHFGGFQIHKEHSHVLRVVNIGASSLRLMIIGPTTPWFRISYDKKGLLAPGMSEEITVTFAPHEWRYYYDAVKIYCGERSENLVVPIHAYPSTSDIALPRFVDFGHVALGTSRTKVIPLSCKIPIQFEYDIAILEAHPDFEVTPLSGVIPPDGTTNVAITFLPTSHRTARMELQFNISQFDFEPVNVSVVGSCLPDISRAEVLASGRADIAAVESRLHHEKIVGKVDKLKAKQQRGPIEVVYPTFKQQETERQVEGVTIPLKVDQSATNFVLSQAPGKMPLKDLFSFIREQREAADNRRKKAAGGDEDGEDGEIDDDKQAAELRFELQYREVLKYDQEKELKSMVAIGEEPTTESAANMVHEGRKRRHETKMQERIHEDVHRFESTLSLDRVAIPVSYRPSINPHWDENVNDTFNMRLQVIDRFVRAVSKGLMRVRARRNIDRLKEAIRSAGVTDKVSCRHWVDAENKAAAAGGSTKPGGEVASGVEEDVEDPMALLLRMAPDFVLPLQMATSQSSTASEERQPVEVVPLDNFEEFKVSEVNVRMDYKVLQYEKYALPPPAAYMRPNDHRKNLEAATEELSVRGPRGDIYDGAEEPLAMPESCLLPPQHDALSLLVPSTECRSYVSLPEFTECDFECRLARQPALLGPLEAEPLLPPNLRSLEKPWLGMWRKMRRLPDPFCHFDPIPLSLAEGGGKQGPRLGGDAGGERLSFLPVGGFSRDLLSDTDSDELEEFEMPPPADDEAEVAFKRMSVTIESKLFLKEQEVEERLHSQCAAANCAVRERLRELNKDLSYANKLYLG
eukprot:gnl/TRDRNA2_/TRDRNA2_182659_c0_seq1.p1 gnl/TRDRNA2_/TRDRNA2_182659_c0~~gnl/TRDRNA2_/TRDRNA2_182659_c0_seq1.p1  ORF type:complete len:862 (-),score=186.92 gnl/TRDRNA2_/TRDRNA2_182659_c0_seq1:211-2757(-)